MAVDKESLFNNYQNVTDKVFLVSLLVEFIGVMLFQFIGGTVTNPNLIPWANGLALAVLIYTAANISGGHLNPAVTFSVFSCGFYPALHSVLYIILQCAGAMVGSLITAGLVPGASVGMGDSGPGCFTEGTVASLSRSQAFGWELLMTFILISCVYACGVDKPGHGSFTPLAVGLSLVACACSGGQYTGAALNPARVIGPSAVFHCGGGVVWVYILAQITAAVAACMVFGVVSGLGPLNPITSMSELGLTRAEAVKMWVLGTPPARLRSEGERTVTDVLEQQKLQKIASLKAVA